MTMCAKVLAMSTRLNAGKAAPRLGVDVKTLQRWDKRWRVSRLSRRPDAFFSGFASRTRVQRWAIHRHEQKPRDCRDDCRWAPYELGRRAVPSTLVIRAPLENLEQIGMANARIDPKLAKELGLTRGDMGPLRHAKACVPSTDEGTANQDQNAHIRVRFG